jgi:superfamily II DNA or RNA helicase
MKENALSGNIVSYWKELGQNRPTLLFAVNVEHSKMLAAQFNAANIPARHIDANSSLEERDRAKADLESGSLRVLASVGVLNVGFDCPAVGTLVIARPTMSKNLHIQVLGRGTRPHPGKKDFRIIDHAGNVLKHGPIEDEMPASLDGYTPRPKGAVSAMIRCQKCLAAYERTLTECPQCGAPKPAKEEHEIVHDQERAIVELTPEILEKIKFDKRIMDLVENAKAAGRKKGWIYHMLKAEFGQEKADIAWVKVARMRRWGP